MFAKSSINFPRHLPSYLCLSNQLLSFFGADHIFFFFFFLNCAKHQSNSIMSVIQGVLYPSFITEEAILKAQKEDVVDGKDLFILTHPKVCCFPPKKKQKNKCPHST